LTALRAQAIRNGRDIGAFDQLVGPLKQMIAKAVSPADALAQLRETAAGIDKAKLAGVFEELLLTADLLGRAVVQEEAKSNG
jgi:phage gp29-like protein